MGRDTTLLTPKVIVREGSLFGPSLMSIDVGPDPHDRPGPQGPDGFGELHQDFIASNGQTVFVLVVTPVNGTKVIMIVDHLLYRPVFDFTITENVITWLNNFVMQAGQDVRVYFTDN